MQSTSQPSNICRFNDAGIPSRLKQKRALGAFVNALIFHYRKKRNIISYTFVSDKQLLEMNMQYLKHDTFTDIITFDLSDTDSPFILGDIYISIERVKENASLLKIQYQLELLRVILHGALHISGFGDKTKKEKEHMRSLEDTWMNQYRN